MSYEFLETFDGAAYAISAPSYIRPEFGKPYCFSEMHKAALRQSPHYTLLGHDNCSCWLSDQIDPRPAAAIGPQNDAPQAVPEGNMSIAFRPMFIPVDGSTGEYQPKALEHTAEGYVLPLCCMTVNGKIVSQRTQKLRQCKFEDEIAFVPKARARSPKDYVSVVKYGNVLIAARSVCFGLTYRDLVQRSLIQFDKPDPTAIFRIVISRELFRVRIPASSGENGFERREAQKRAIFDRYRENYLILSFAPEKNVPQIGSFPRWSDGRLSRPVFDNTGGDYRSTILCYFPEFAPESPDLRLWARSACCPEGQVIPYGTLYIDGTPIPTAQLPLDYNQLRGKDWDVRYPKIKREYQLDGVWCGGTLCSVNPLFYNISFNDLACQGIHAQ